ncbi:MAG: ADP-ribosylation factor-like protein [bacterium]
MKLVDIMILVYDVTDKKSFDDIKNWFKLIKENSSGRQVVLVIIGNKSDLIH